jgi:hypothetical protein
VPENLLTLLNYLLLILLYLFFARVLWAVWSEVRTPRAPVEDRRQHMGARSSATPYGGTTTAQPAAPKATKGRHGRVGRLVVIEPRSRKGAAFAIGSELTLGRAAGCTISIPDDTFISQLHARVYTENGEVYIEDLGSTNGSMLNGNRVTRASVIHRGDRLQLGSTVLEAE